MNRAEQIAALERVQDNLANAGLQESLLAIGRVIASLRAEPSAEQEREECAKVALGEKVDADATGSEEDRAYNQACAYIAERIRARTASPVPLVAVEYVMSEPWGKIGVMQLGGPTGYWIVTLEDGTAWPDGKCGRSFPTPEAARDCIPGRAERN